MKKKRKVFDDIKTGDVIYRILFWTTNPFKIRTIREIIQLTVTSIKKGNSPYKDYEYFDVKTDGGYGFIMNLEKNPKNIKSEKLKFGKDLEVIFDRNTVEELINKTIEYHESEFEKTFEVHIEDKKTENIKTVGDMVNAIIEYKSQNN